MQLIKTIAEDYEPQLRECETPPRLCRVDEEDGIFFNESLAQDRRIRTVLYQKILHAKQALPGGLSFMIYESFRPVSRQRELWNAVYEQLCHEHPNDNAACIKQRAKQWVSDPDGVGSGHLFAAAVDITLCEDKTGRPLDMGCKVQEFGDKTATWCAGLSREQKAHRLILINALAGQGILNYPPEWWHFSYGDRIWAILQRLPETLYSPIAS